MGRNSQGGGGFVSEVIWLAQEAGGWDLLGILTDRDDLQGTSIRSLPVLGRPADWTRWGEAWFVVALGAPRSRRAVVRAMEDKGAPKFATLIHPSVVRGPDLQLGEGCLVAAGALLTVRITAGRHCIINLGCTIGHGSELGDYCTLAPLTAVSGEVHLGPGVEAGTGAIFLPGVSVGAGSVLGAGAVVTRPVGIDELALGLPAQVIKKIEKPWGS